MKLAVVTDSSAYLPERIKNHPDLFVIPIPLIMDGKIYNEGIDIEADEYYGLLKTVKIFLLLHNLSKFWVYMRN